jgi:hypothetical protein
VNKDLYGKTIQLPKEVVEYLETCFNHVGNSDANTEGHNRNQELRDTGYATYQQLGRMKNWFDNYQGDGKDAPYILNGADYMRTWVDRTLEDMRNGDTMHKHIQQEYSPEPIDDKIYDDMGWLADMNRPSKEHSKFADDVAITENLKRINEIMKKLL